MTSKYLSGVLIIALSLTLVTPSRADTLKKDGDEIVAGIAGVAAAIGVVVTILLIHYSKKHSITGCVAASGGGMTITDEKDKKIYVLSGNTAGITAGDRVKLQGRTVKLTGSSQTLEWDATKMNKDLGVCQP
jgi:hypothetical protein